jgi:hypothetical protein
VADGNAPFTIGQAKVVASTPKAIMVAFEDFADDIDPVQIPDTDAFWIPVSVVHDDSECWDSGTEGTLIVKSWWAEKQGLL